jgi:glycosyltransferase involved in cell wall biosynthesis
MRRMSQDSTPERPRLSLVIPAYNEANRLPQSLRSVRAYFSARARPYEVIVVDDGSTDATAVLVEHSASSWPALRLVRGPHRGKGGAVRAGILAARGDYVALADADFSMPVQEFDRLAPDMLGSYDVAIGSREVAPARRYGEPWYRHLMGRVFNRVVQLVLLPGIEDSQCGFKCLRREVALDLVNAQTIYGWGFDVELLYIARQRGYSIHEVGVDWYYMPESRVSPLRDTLTMLQDVARIYLNARQGVYARSAQDTNERKGAAFVPDRLAAPDQ